MTNADFLAAIVAQAPELNDQQIRGLRQLLPPAPVAPCSSSATHRAPTRPHAFTTSPDVAAQAA